MASIGTQPDAPMPATLTNATVEVHERGRTVDQPCPSAAQRPDQLTVPQRWRLRKPATQGALLQRFTAGRVARRTSRRVARHTLFQEVIELLSKVLGAGVRHDQTLDHDAMERGRILAVVDPSSCERDVNASSVRMKADGFIGVNLRRA